MGCSTLRPLCRGYYNTHSAVAIVTVCVHACVYVYVYMCVCVSVCVRVSVCVCMALLLTCAEARRVIRFNVLVQVFVHARCIDDLVPAHHTPSAPRPVAYVVTIDTLALDRVGKPFTASRVMAMAA